MNSKLMLLVGSIILLTACNQKENKLKSSTTEVNKKADSLLSSLKDISDYQMAFLDANLSKVKTVLGEPNDKGESRSFSHGHYVYYDKVKENNVVKHLVIFFGYASRSSMEPTVISVSAVENGKNFTQERYGTITIQKPKGFEVESKDADQIKITTDAFIKTTDLNKLENYDLNVEDQSLTFYYDKERKLQVIKVVQPYSSGNETTSLYYFKNDKLKFYKKTDKDNDLAHFEKYIANDIAVKTYYNGKLGDCDDYDCDFSAGSEPYRFLDIYKSNPPAL
jgi:hypothetical protein